MFEKIKKWYRMGLWTQDMVKNAVIKNIITKEQMIEILNQ